MNTFKKNNMLSYIAAPQETESIINQDRIAVINDKKLPDKGKIIYIISREFRYYDNFAIAYAKEICKKNSYSLEVIFKLPVFENDNKTKFFDDNYQKTKKDFEKNSISIREFNQTKDINDYLEITKPGLVIKDFNPIEEEYLKKNFRIEEIDGHNILPARVVSDKQEYNAASFRRKVYAQISEFLTQYPNPPQNTFKPLKDFIENHIDEYAQYRNNPVLQVTSKLSAYMNWGFLSSQRAALEVLKSKTSSENKEEFLEELIVRKELSDNFCLYCKNYQDFSCTPSWAKETLKKHSVDLRHNLLTLKEFENAKTPDDLWNAAQRQLLKDGKIEGYLRMYWAKQLLYWTSSPKEALDIAIYLNDKYAYDAPSTNGYTAILWSIGGLHDRAFMERPVIGKIRPMTYNGAKSKFDIAAYIQKYS